MIEPPSPHPESNAVTSPETDGRFHRHPNYLAGDACETYRLSARQWLLLVGYGLVVLGAALGSNRVLTQHEVMFAEPAREMLATGDWITPRMAGVPFNDKPPLTAWTIAATMAVTGSESPWVVRLPAMLSALITAGWMATLAARWFGSQVGLLAGLIQCSTFYVLMQARLAESDMPFCAAVTTALSAFALAQVDGPLPRRGERWWSMLFYLGTALAVLTKGPLGAALVFPPAVLFALWQRDRRAVRFLVDPAGLLVFFVLVAAWPAAAYRANPAIGQDWVMHNLDRFLGRMDDGGGGGRQPALFYFYMIPLLMLPWTFPLVAALVRGTRQGLWSTPGWRMAAAWVAPGVALLTLSVWKHKHYAIPVLPPLSLLAAVGLWHHVTARHRRDRPYRGQLLVNLYLAVVAGIAALWTWAPRDAAPLSLLLAVAAAGGTLAWMLAQRHRLAGQLVAMFATVGLVAVGVQVWVIPRHDTYRPVTELAERANRVVPPGKPVYLLSLAVQQISYYLQPPLVRIDNPVLAVETLCREPDQDHYAVMPRYLAHELAAKRPVEILDACTGLLRHTTDADRLLLVHVPARAGEFSARQAAPAGEATLPRR